MKDGEMEKKRKQKKKLHSPFILTGGVKSLNWNQCLFVHAYKKKDTVQKH